AATRHRLTPLAPPPVPRRLPGRDLSSGSPRFRETDRDRLLPALHLLSGAARTERAALPLVHGLLDLLRRLSSVFTCHDRNLHDPAGAIPVPLAWIVHHVSECQEAR